MDVALSHALQDTSRLSAAVWPDKRLRGYQVEPARMIVQAVTHLTGETLAAVFARQSGKDEMLAQVLAHLLILHQFDGGEIVVGLPSLVPQGQISKQRLMDRLEDARPLISELHEEGPVVRVGRASVRYMSASETAQTRGATASLLLVANEAQDIDPDVWDARFEPMTASTNAPKLQMGTVWTNDTLLAREMLAARSAGHLYMADWQRVARDVPTYGDHVRGRIAALGENHPFIRTEYRLLALDGDGLLFDTGRQAQMRGTHSRQRAAGSGQHIYAILVDVAGEEETREAGIHHAAERGRDRDMTVLTVVEVAPGRVIVPGERPPPIYRVVDRRVWRGANHLQLAQEITDLARRIWRAAAVVVDATGIGHGIAAMLRAALGERIVKPFVFSSASKSDLGWRLLAAIGAGRYQEYADDGQPDTREFWREVGACSFAVQRGPARIMHWSVPESQGHDDLLLSAALCGALDDIDLRPRIAIGR